MRRWPLFAAIAYVVLLFIGLFILPTAPEVTASGAKLVRYYRDHGNGMRLVAWCGTLATIPIALLVAHLRSRLTGAMNLMLGAGLFAVWVIAAGAASSAASHA